jgi:midasin (ATPase involved in ribosome maturation)
MARDHVIQYAAIIGIAILSYVFCCIINYPLSWVRSSGLSVAYNLIFAMIPVVDFLKDVADLLLLLFGIMIWEGLDHFKIVLAVVLAAAGVCYGYRLRNDAGKKRGCARGQGLGQYEGYGDERYEYEGDEDYGYDEEGDYEYEEEMEYEVEEDEAWDYDSEEDEDYDPEGEEGYEFDEMDGFHQRPGFLNNWD